MKALLALWRSLSKELKIVLLLSLLLHAIPLTWGLPASDTWDVDGIAPRDFGPGLVLTFTQGEYFTYPPFHFALLAILTLPITLVGLFRAESLSGPALVREFLSPAYMTSMALVARVVAVVMSLGIVVAIAKIAEQIAPERAKKPSSVFAALVVTLGAPFTYYAHVTNLDIPYCFWGSLAMLAVVRTIARHEPSRLRSAFVFAAFAVTTKDQAYAMFLLSVPTALALWLAFDPDARKGARGILRDAGLGAALAAGLVLLIDGVIANPSGFRARLRFLSGSASQDYATYANDAHGRLGALFDMPDQIVRHYGTMLVGPLAIAGLIAVVRARRDHAARWLSALFPLFVAVSFTVAFNLVARRVEERFTLPQMIVLGLYAGCALGVAWDLFSSCVTGKVARIAAQVACLVPLVPTLHQALRVDATMLSEPRYEAEVWLREHAHAGDVVEMHGTNVYLLRAPPFVQATRVGPLPAAKRSPMPGVNEIEARLSSFRERNPKFIVANECYTWRFMLPPEGVATTDHRVRPTVQRMNANDEDATAFFHSLYEGRAGYRMTLDARIRSTLFPRRELHSSLGCAIAIYERE